MCYDHGHKNISTCMFLYIVVIYTCVYELFMPFNTILFHFLKSQNLGMKLFITISFIVSPTAKEGGLCLGPRA